MKLKHSLTFHLLAAPLSAALAVVMLAGLSLLDFARTRDDLDGDLDRKTPEPEIKTQAVPIRENVPHLSEDDALRSLKERPGRAAVQRLWSLEKHRDHLFKLLLDRGTPGEVRLFLLGAFDEAAPQRAAEAARDIAADKELSEGPLVFSALEVLSRHGTREDLKLFGERQGETHQLRTLREEYRDQLQSQIR